MSNYKNFIKDFPSRCRDLLHLAHEQATSSDREVTLALMVASAGFLVPFERLRDDGPYIQPIQDRKIFPKTAAKLDDLLAQSWGDSPFNKPGAGSWATGTLQRPDTPIDSWAELRGLQPSPPTTTVGTIATIIRNALAHGNIYTCPTQQRQIHAIIFVSGGKNRKTGKLKPYKFVYVSPSDFHEFLLTWFDLLSMWDISQEDIVEALEKAA